MQDSLLLSSCDSWSLRIHASFHSARKINAVDRKRHAESIGSTRFDLQSNVGTFLGAGDFRGKVLPESRVKHLMILLLPDSSWEFDDTFLPSEAAAPLGFLDKRDA